MTTIQITESTKRKLEQLARHRHSSPDQVLAELLEHAAPTTKRKSVRDLLKGVVAQPLTVEDFDALHQDMVKRYGSPA